MLRRRADLLVCFLAACATARPVPTPERTIPGAAQVTFPSQDSDLTHQPPTRLTGWLFRPEGPGPFPAIVALHGCAGLYGKGRDFTPRHRDWAERLVGQGYVVLFPDSFGSRGLDEICSHKPQPVRPGYERNRDAYGALTYLQTLSFVRPDAIGLLGWSNGGMTVLSAVSAHTHARPDSLAQGFRVAVAFYPGCKPTLERDDWTPPVAPLHILIGASDDWTPASECVALAQRTPLDLVVYPDSFHDFDDPSMPAHQRHNVASTASGLATIGSNPAARADALTRVTQIFKEALRPSSMPPSP